VAAAVGAGERGGYSGGVGAGSVLGSLLWSVDAYVAWASRVALLMVLALAKLRGVGLAQ